MQRDFFEFLCDLRADQAASAGDKPPVRSYALRSQLQQLRRLLSTRRPPIPEGTSAGSVPREFALLEVDRLLTFGFEQPCRSRIGEKKDLDNLKQQVTECISRYFPNSRVVVNAALDNSELGRTVVPVNVKVSTPDAGSPSIDLGFDRLSRDVDIVSSTTRLKE
jgi:hypothetical protein